MAELYDQNKIYANRPTASSQAPQSADAELEAMLAELPPEERETARAKITAPPTGEDIYKVMQERNANGEVFNMNLDQYRQYRSYIKTKEVDVLDAMGTAAEGVFNEIMAAAGSIADKPLESTAKLTPSLVEAFAQGTRSLYGMAAQSQDPNSVFFRVKNALTANGDDEQSEFQQFMDAQAFNVHSMRLATGKDTIIMDKDVINPEMTQVMSYIADPTLFIPFGGIAAKGARMIGMGEGLAKASARAAQIQRKVLGGAIKWGVGAPIEFLGTATRNTIDYGLEKAGSVFEVATGMPAAEARTTAQMYGWYTASAALEGRNMPFPVFGDVAGAMVGSTTARGVGEALTMVGEQMQKQQQFGRGILSYAGQALRDANKSGVPLSKHAKALLNVLDKVDPLFVYSADISKGAAEGMAIGAGLGYLSAGEEGAASGAGAGMALGAAGAGMGSVVSDIGNGRLYDRIAVQRQMVIEGLRQVDPQKAAAFEAFVKTAELTGNRDLIAQVDGIITGIDVMAPNVKFVARSNADHKAWLLSQRIDPDTGRLMEPLAMFPEFGTNRASRAKALSFLSFVGNRFDGDHKLLIKELQGLPQDHALRKQFMRLSGEQKKAVFDALDKAATPEFKEIFGGKNGYEFYGDLNYAEANVARVNAMFDAGNKTQANEMIRQFIKNETGKDGKLSSRGELLKQKLATEGYFDKDGNMRPSRLKDVEVTIDRHIFSKGFVFRRDSTGQVEININLSSFGKETAPHELFHAVMLDSVLKPDFIDRLGQNLLGKFDADGKRIENASVDIKQVRQFFQRYIDALHGKNSQEAVNETARLEAAMKEYESRGTTNKISLDTKDTLEGLLEEFGSYYFGAFINDKPVDFLFRGGELGAMREIMGNAKQGFLDFWRSKIKGINPDFNFDPAVNDKIFKAFEKDGIRTKNASLDLLMRDFVRATAMANKQGGFDVSRLSPAARETFVKNNGIRGLSMTRDANGNLVRSSQRKVIQEQMRTGKEIYKVLSGLDPKFRQGLITDGEGNLSGRLSPEAMEAIVQSGHVDRAWVDKIQQGYNILDGKGGNVIHFGYLGRTAQIGDYAWPRLVGSDVPFKNRQAVLLGVDFKVGKDGKMYSLFHTLDKAVIDGRADVLWSDPAVRTLWDGDRGAMEADFFRYLANASLPSSDVNRKTSAGLLEDGTGAGARRRDVLHQMLGIVKAEGDVYLNKPIAEIPYGIRHSVTTFNVDGIANMRVGTDRWNVVPENAFKDLSRNFQPSEMARENTPNGAIITHASGFKFAEKNGNIHAYTSAGRRIGVYDNIELASKAAKNEYSKVYDNIDTAVAKEIQEQDNIARKFQPLEEGERIEARRLGDVFLLPSMRRFVEGRTLLRQTREEHIFQRALEAIENPEQLLALAEKFASQHQPVRDERAKLIKNYQEVTQKIDEIYKLIDSQYKELEKLRPSAGSAIDSSSPEFLNWKQNKEALSFELLRLQGERDNINSLQMEFEKNHKYEIFEPVYSEIQEAKARFTNTTATREELANMFAKRIEANAKQKDYSGVLEALFAQEYDDKIQTGKPFVAVTTHGTGNIELMMSRLFAADKLGSHYDIPSSRMGSFSAGSQNTSRAYAKKPRKLENTVIDKVNRVAKMSEDGLYLSNDFKITLEQDINNLWKRVEENNAKAWEHIDENGKNKFKDAYIKEKLRSVLSSGSFITETWMSENLKQKYMRLWKMDEVNFKNHYPDAPMQLRKVIRMDNPYVVVDPRSYEEHRISPHMKRAMEAGHDGIVFKRFADGGERDNVYVVFKDFMKDNIKVIDTSFDGEGVPRGSDETGRVLKGGRELKLAFQPTEGAEGGRVYDQNSNEFKFNFIGKQAEENQDLIQGKNLEFVKRKDGSYRITLTDNGEGYDTRKIGHITATIDDSSVVAGEGVAEISSNIDSKYRGQKLANILYSEMAERLRSMGIKYVDGTIVNKDGIPVQVRNTVIGQTYYKGSNKPAFREDTAKKVQAVQSVYPSNGIGVYNELDPKARYQPTEGEEYRGTHKAPSGENGEGSLDAMDRTYPEDIYSANGARYYGSGDKTDRKIHEIIMKARGRPDAIVTVYRAIPKGIDASIVKGDWVTPIREYAVLHGNRWEQGMTILEKKVKASELFTEGNSLYEFGWSPKEPTEGGRTYTPEQMSGKFIGRIAEESPSLTKGLKLYYGKVPQGMGAVGVTLRNNKGDVVANIKAMINRDAPNYANIEYSEVTKKQQGKGFGKLVYSELIERLRSLGIEEVSGTVIDSKGRPQAIRRTVIDDVNKGLYKEFTKEKRGWKTTEEESSDLSEGIDVISQLHRKARYQPAEYQGGDDYYKPKKNIFERRDEQGLLVRKAFVSNSEITGDPEARGGKTNPEYVGWEDIGHYPQQGTTAENLWEAKNSGLWYWKDDKGVKTKNPMQIDRPDFTHAEWFDRAFQYEEDKPTIYGRYEKPKYDKNGNLVEKGKLSMSSNYRGEIKDMADANFYKEAVAKSLGVPEDHIDAYLFGANDKIKSQRGYGLKDELPIKFQPKEGEKGGRVYSDEQFNQEFIGKFASENPEIANKFFIRIKENDGGTLEDWDYKMVIYDKDTKKAVARTKWQMFENDDGILEDAAADVEILNDAYKGMKLSHLMQSERLERSRFLGAEKVRSQITNEEGIPIKNYAKTIGADKGEITSSFADRFNEDGSTKYIPATMENFKQEMDLSKAHADRVWKPTVYYRAKLDKKAWYQPSEAFGNFKTERTPTGVLLKNAAGYVISRVGSKYRVYNPYKAVIGVFDSEEQAKKRIYKEEPRR